MDYFAALTAFVEAAQLGNFSRAADRLAIKASTISRYVRDLEGDLGIALFNRSTRSLRLTEGGRTFLEHAQTVLRELEHARSAAAALNQHPRGHLQLIAPSAFARRHVIPVLGAFAEHHPEVHVHLTCEDAEVGLIDVGADLAIRSGHLPDSSLKARKIIDEHWVLCAAPGLFAERAPPDHPREIACFPFIAGNLADHELHWRQGAQRLTTRMTASSWISDIEGRLIAAEAGQGLALLPTWLAGDALARGALVGCLPRWQCSAGGEATALWFLYPPKRIVSSKVRSFIDFMLEHICTPA